MMRAVQGILAAFACVTFAVAGDWPQWRGPQRTGATTGPALAAAWPKEGLTKLWESEPIPGDDKFGYGSPVVVGNRVYQFVSGANPLPSPTCKLLATDVNLLGDINLVNKATLAKLVPLKDKEFATQADLDKWFADSGIDPAVQKLVNDLITATRDYDKDTIVCLDLTSGKTLWKKGLARKPNPNNKSWGGSTTPCVAGGKVYACGLGGIYCLDAADGKEVWTDPKGCANSSFLVVGGVAVLQGGPVRAFDAQTGKLLWTQPKAGGENNSLASWEKDGVTYLIANGRNLSAVDLKTGQIAWTVPGGTTSTPVVSGDYAVVQGEKALYCYKLAPTTAEQVWAFDVRGAEMGSPVIHNGHVYAQLAANVACFELATGKVKWNEKAGRSDYASPILADGKILLPSENGGVAMVDANHDKFALLGKAKVGLLRCVGPTVADGRLLVRTRTCLVAYDLTATPPIATQPAAGTK